MIIRGIATGILVFFASFIASLMPPELPKEFLFGFGLLAGYLAADIWFN